VPVTDELELLHAYASAARRAEQDVREWVDRETGGRLLAALALIPGPCRVDGHLTAPDRLDLTVQVQYTLLVGAFEATWYEVRDAVLFGDGSLEVEWRPDEVPHVPFGAYVPGLLDDRHVADADHPYWAFTDRSTLAPSALPLPPEEADDYAVWLRKVSRVAR
jgi:hypothetical protein